MPVKTKIDIFKNMKKSELEDEIRNYTLHYRYYQRLLAIKMVSEGNSITEVANQINKAYPTVHKWISTCEKEGLEGLKPSFVGGGHNAKLNNNQLLQLDKIIAENPNMTLKELRSTINTCFSVDYSTKQVRIITKKLGYNYRRNAPNFYKGHADEVEFTSA